jgi:hypothetical protein
VHLLYALNNKLGDALSARDRKRSLAEVDEQSLYFATVVAIDGTGAVKDGDAVSERETRPWTHLGFESRR